MKAIQIGIAIALTVGAFLFAMQMSSGKMIGNREKEATQQMSSEMDQAIEAYKEDISKRFRGWRGIP